MDTRDDLGDRMKAWEAATPAVIPPESAMVIRLDGRAFHSYTRKLERPFDRRLADDLDQAATEVCADVDGAQLAYLQSDEISIVVPPRSTHAGEHWFGGGVQKIASVAASHLTAHFVLARGDIAQFDARAIALPADELRPYLCWRQADARRNSLSMIAGVHFSHRQLHRVGTAGRLAMLAERGVDPDRDYDPRDRNGRVILRQTYTTDVTYTDRRTGTTHEVKDVTRSRWTVDAAPLFRTLDAIPTPAAA